MQQQRGILPSQACLGCVSIRFKPKEGGSAKEKKKKEAKVEEKVGIGAFKHCTLRCIHQPATLT